MFFVNFNYYNNQEAYSNCHEERFNNKLLIELNEYKKYLL